MISQTWGELFGRREHLRSTIWRKLHCGIRSVTYSRAANVQISLSWMCLRSTKSTTLFQPLTKPASVHNPCSNYASLKVHQALLTHPLDISAVKWLPVVAEVAAAVQMNEDAARLVSRQNNFQPSVTTEDDLSQRASLMTPIDYRYILYFS